MTTASHSGLSLIGSVDAQRVEQALTLIAPRWTTWTAQTLAQDGSPMRVRDVAAQLPFIRLNLVSKRLFQMHADGLVTRPDTRFGAPYQLSALGQSLAPVHHALSEWSQAHIPLGTAAGAERVEDAVRRLYLRNTTAMIQLLDTANGPMRFAHIAEETGLDNGLAYYRLHRLQLDGLVTRTGPRHGDPYTLTEAGQALGPVYAAAEHWGNPAVTPRPTPVPTATATRTYTEPRAQSQDIRAAVALRRTTATPGGLFSHASPQQPQVPATVTAHSAPRRGR
ncbi:winged helix-turn-helix transcriptional regulator [Streptomyces sp. NPDC002018]|uniref:winged helix-turn-helix transcriptional regulator n=1 Tax=Streptomyces sp. NPDC002018 TaxID=3364629 RepID=UPI003678AA6C